MDRLVAAIRAHPWLTATWVLGSLLGGTLGYVLLDPAGFSSVRRVAAGVFFGAFCALILTANRMIGSTQER